MEMRICILCGDNKPISQFGKHYTRKQSFGRRKVCEKCKKNRLYFKFRLEFLKHFNYKCQCCGENDIRFLTLDHVQNDGHKDEHLSPIQIYRKAWEERFNSLRWSCLCWNCNCGRSQNKGVCPHRDSVRKEDVINKYLIMAGKIKNIEESKQIEHFATIVTKIANKDELEKLIEVLKK